VEERCDEWKTWVERTSGDLENVATCSEVKLRKATRSAEVGASVTSRLANIKRLTVGEEHHDESCINPQPHRRYVRTG
jgi:hypothetical protein